MSYSSTISFSSVTGVLSGTITSNAGNPVSDVVISGFSDAAVLSGAVGAAFGQARTDGSGNWALSTASLPGGTHVVSITCDCGQPIATTGDSTTITTSGPGVSAALGSARTGLTINNMPRA